MNNVREGNPQTIYDSEGRRSNLYDLSIYEGLPKIGGVSPELQKVAISYGLSTLRTEWTDFSAWDSDGNRLVFGLSYSEASSPVPGVMTSNKQLTRELLRAVGAPVPQGRTFGVQEIEAAIDYATSIGYPVVVKPLAGKGGVGVVAGIEDEEGLRWAVEEIQNLQKNRGKLVVEQHVPGKDYRIYVAFGRVLSAVLRSPASVIGDGFSTVEELVEQKNALRRGNPHTRTRLIKIGEPARYQLNKQGLSWDSVPEAGRTVVLAGGANISQGGDSTEVLPELHESILSAAVRAVDAIPGLDQAGVDFLLEDHRRDLADQGGGICEINTKPALMANQAPVFGEIQPVARELLRLAANAKGVKLAEQSAENVRIGVRAQGARNPSRLAKWVTSRAQGLGLGGQLREIGDAHLRFRLHGPVERVTALVAAFHAGGLDSGPDYVKTVPTTALMPVTFQGLGA